MDYSSLSDEELLRLYNQSQPDYSSMSDDELLAAYQQIQQPQTNLWDKIKGAAETTSNELQGAASGIADLAAGLVSMPIGALAKGTTALASPLAGDTVSGAEAKVNELLAPISQPFGRAFPDTKETAAYKAIQWPFEKITEYAIQKPGKLAEQAGGSELGAGTRIAAEMALGLLPFARRGNVNPNVERGSVLVPRTETPKNFNIQKFKQVKEINERKAAEEVVARNAQSESKVPGEQLELPITDRNPPRVFDTDQAPMQRRAEIEAEMRANAEAERIGMLRDEQAQSPQYELFGPKETPRYVETIPYKMSLEKGAQPDWIEPYSRQVGEARASWPSVDFPLMKGAEAPKVAGKRQIEIKTEEARNLNERQRGESDLPPELQGIQDLYTFDPIKAGKDTVKLLRDNLNKLGTAQLQAIARNLHDKLAENIGKIDPEQQQIIYETTDRISDILAAREGFSDVPPPSTPKPTGFKPRVIPGGKQSGMWKPFETSSKKQKPIAGFKNFDEFQQHFKGKGYSDSAIAKSWAELGGAKPDPTPITPNTKALSQSFKDLAPSIQRAYDELGQRERTLSEVRDQIINEPDYVPGTLKSRGLVGLNELAAGTNSTGVRWAIGNVLVPLRRWNNWAQDTLNHTQKGIRVKVKQLQTVSPLEFTDLWAKARASANFELPEGLTPRQQALWNFKVGIDKSIWPKFEAKLKELFPEKRVGKELINYFNDNIEGDYVVRLEKTVTNKTTGLPEKQLVWITATKTMKEAKAASEYFSRISKDIEGLAVVKPEYKPDMMEMVRMGPDKTAVRMGQGSRAKKFANMLGFIDMMEVAAQTPEFVKIQEMMTKTQQSLDYGHLGTTQRANPKSGKTLAPGNKPWKTPMENAIDGWNHWFDYVQNFAEWMGYQEGMGNLKEFFNDPEIVIQKPELAKRIKEIVAQAHDMGPGFTDDIAQALGKEFGKITGQEAGLLRSGMFEAKNLATLAILGTFRNFIVQELQPGQVYPAWVTLLRDKYKLVPDSHVMPALVGGAVQMFLHSDMSFWKGGSIDTARVTKILGKDLGEIVQYAQDNHVTKSHILDRPENYLSTSLTRKGYEGVKEFGSAFISTPDSAARTGFFVAMVKWLESADVPRETALDLAANLDRLAMVDYNRYNVPGAYKRLGDLAGDQAASLSRFKHNQYWQAGFFAKNSKKALGIQLATMWGMAGLLGMYGISELTAVQDLLKESGWMQADTPNAEQWLLQSDKPWKRWAAWGPLSMATGFDFSSALGSPDPVPNSALDALMPLGSWYGNFAGGTADLAKGLATGNETQVGQGLFNMAPRGLKIYPEIAFFSEKNKEDGMDVFNTKPPFGFKFKRDKADVYMQGLLGGRSLKEAEAVKRGYQNNDYEEVIRTRTKKLRTKFHQFRKAGEPFNSSKLSDIKQEYLDLVGPDGLEAIEREYSTGQVRIDPEIKRLGKKATPKAARQYETLKKQERIK